MIVIWMFSPLSCHLYLFKQVSGLMGTSVKSILIMEEFLCSAEGNNLFPFQY